MINSLLKRIVYHKWYSLQNPKYIRKQEVYLLEQSFQRNKEYAEKISFLKELEHHHQLQNFYQNKSLVNMSEEELFYLMISNIPYNLSRVGQASVISKVHSVFFKCLLYKEFGWLNQVEQYIITLSFNEQVGELRPKQISFCLGVIHDFQIAAQTLDIYRIQATLKLYADDPQHAHDMLLINGYLSQIDRPLKKILSAQNLKNWMVNNKNWDFRSIYFVLILSESLELQLKSQLKEQLDKLMKTAVKQFKIDQFQTNYLVYLLKYYPLHAQKINILHFTPKGYLAYLQYFKDHPDQPINNHKIPPSVFELSTTDIFNKIIHLRNDLKIDTVLSITKDLTEYFVSSLNPLKAFLGYLRQHKISTTTQIQYLIQRTIKQKLQLYQFDPQKLEQYELQSILMLLNKLNKMNICSIDFWRLTVRWIQHLLTYNDQFQILQSNHLAYINLLSLVVSKNFKESTRELIYAKISSLLQGDNHWGPGQLMKLSSVLSYYKIGQHKLWLLLEHRLYPYINKNSNIKKIKQRSQYQIIQQILSKIAINFNRMGKGSYKFWTQLNQTLSNKFKKQILEKMKMPTSQAHIYFKIAS